MKGIKIAIGTQDQDRDSLIVIGKDISAEFDAAMVDSVEASVIKSVEVFLDTVDDNVRHKSGSMVAKIIIKGEIPTKSVFRNKFRKLSEWSRDGGEDTQYRNICIGIRDADKSFMCVYSISRVFVVDYREKYLTDDNIKSEFELYLNQEQDNLDKIFIDNDWPKAWDWARKG